MLGAIAGVGAALGIGGSLLKKKPKIPSYKPVNQQAEQEAAIAGNLASFGKASELADMTAQADQDRLDSILARTLPNYRELISGAGSAVQDMIAGRLPNQDQQMLMRRSAERGAGLGIANTGAGRNLTARDLGLSSLQMTQAGLGAFNQLSSNVRGNFTVNPMSTTSMYVSPAQRISNAIQENQFRYQALVGKRQSDAANSFQSRLGGALSSVGGTMLGYGLSAPSGGFGSTGLTSTSGVMTTPYSGGTSPIGGNFDPMTGTTMNPAAGGFIPRF